MIGSAGFKTGEFLDNCSFSFALAQILILNFGF